MKQFLLLNAANIVSGSRLVFAACFIGLTNNGIRLVLLVIAALTDFIDGWLARKRHTDNKAGALIDAIADRVFALTAACAIYANGTLSLTHTLILLSRDIMTAIGFIVARIIPWLRRFPFKARAVGKVVTVLQYVSMGVALSIPSLVPVAIALTGLASAVAVADYTLALWRGRAPA